MEGKMERADWDIDGIIKAYFGQSTMEPFADAKEEWEVWQRFLDMLCVTLLYIKEEETDKSSFRVGCLLNDQEVMRALEPGEHYVFEGKKQFNRIFQVLIAREENSQELDQELPFGGFIGSGLLLPAEILAFIMAAAPDRNRKYERVFGILQEETQPTAKPTIGLVCDLAELFLADGFKECSCLWDEDRFFCRFLLEEIPEAGTMSRMSKPLSLNKRVIQILQGEPMQMSKLSRCGEMLEYQPEMEDLLAHRRELEELIRVFSAMLGGGHQGVMYLRGPEGVGKRFLMKALASVAELDVLCINLKRLFSEDDAAIHAFLKEAVLKSVYEKNLIYMEGDVSEREELPRFQRILGFLQNYVNLLFWGGERNQPGSLAVKGDWYTICLTPPDAIEQKSFWRYFAEKNEIRFTEDVDIDQVVSRYDMTPGRISQVLNCAMLDADLDETGFLVSEKTLERHIRMKCSAEFGEYATRLESPFHWEDLQLQPESRKLLWEACDRIRYRSVVNGEFGFGRKLPYGKGISIVLYGPPGTGKTMAAQVLANELGLDIYRIDLSQIGSKYIGETEKNMGAVFQAAKFSNAILFFDEADALFTKRTDVSNSNDRYANAETAYLLQKIEEYSGVSILATNVMQNFDNAFKRRMTFMIPLEQPDEAARLLLWQNVFPEEAPLEDDIEFAVYAKTAELTGSNIKSAALTAAYRAAAEHRSIRNQDLIDAIELEYRRTGRMGITSQLYEALYMRI